MQLISGVVLALVTTLVFIALHTTVGLTPTSVAVIALGFATLSGLAALGFRYTEEVHIDLEATKAALRDQPSVDMAVANFKLEFSKLVASLSVEYEIDLPDE